MSPLWNVVKYLLGIIGFISVAFAMRYVSDIDDKIDNHSGKITTNNATITNIKSDLNEKITNITRNIEKQFTTLNPKIHLSKIDSRINSLEEHKISFDKELITTTEEYQNKATDIIISLEKSKKKVELLTVVFKYNRYKRDTKTLR